MTEIVIPNRKLYMVRHGEYDENSPGERLNEWGREQIGLRAQQIKQDLNKRNLSRNGIILFSSGFPRALDSVIEIGAALDLADYGLEVRTSSSFYGDMPENCPQSFEFLNKHVYSIGILACHKDLLTKFPQWFMRTYHPEKNIADFKTKFKNDYASMVYLDFKSGELVDMTTNPQVS
jgi:broad specificity phosphatase PhoE